MTKRRIDLLLVERGLAENQAKAQALIMAGKVLVGGKPVAQAGTLVDPTGEISLVKPPPFVGRGGIKLECALDYFRIDVSGKVAADIGASTGGFTDCLLKRGTAKVYAIDVGYGQLDYTLRQDPRVVVMENVNARYEIPLPEKVDLVTIDVSFISVEKIIPSAAQLLKDNGIMIVLVKPQFEAHRKEVGVGGVVKNIEVHALVLARFIKWLTEHNFRLKGIVASPIKGASGNQEFLVLVGLT